MKSLIFLFIGIFVIGCNSEPTLQKYFVENTENKNFIAFDVSPSIINADETKLTFQQKAALKTFDKMNILAFKINDSNKSQFETERNKVSKILNDKKYQQLMKVSSGKEGASVSFVGDEEHIDEFVLFANKKENGFAVVRILGKDMNPTGIMSMLSVLQSSNINLEQLKPLQELVSSQLPK